LNLSTFSQIEPSMCTCGGLRGRRICEKVEFMRKEEDEPLSVIVAHWLWDMGRIKYRGILIWPKKEQLSDMINFVHAYLLTVVN
jgi:hypothetical protein